MPGERPPIPRPMRRDVLIEAGYRCAIPRCGATTVEVHHIVDYAEVREHTFDNLIVLCANCHTRATKREIDPKALRQIKDNLSILSHRYTEVERRLLRHLAEKEDGTRRAPISGSMLFLVDNVVSDGLVAFDASRSAPGSNFRRGGEWVHVTGDRVGCLTDRGVDFVANWMAGEPLT